MDAYVEIVRMQSDARLSELRREAAHDRLIRSLPNRRRSLGSLRILAALQARRRQPVEEAAVAVLRPLSSPVLAADEEGVIAQRRAS